MWFDGKFEKLQRQRILKWSPKIIEQNRNESKHKLNTYQNGCDSNNRSKNSDSTIRSLSCQVCCFIR